MTGLPDEQQTVSQCHSEALAEESLIRNILISLDSSLRSEDKMPFFWIMTQSVRRRAGPPNNPSPVRTALPGGRMAGGRSGGGKQRPSMPNLWLGGTNDSIHK